MAFGPPRCFHPSFVGLGLATTLSQGRKTQSGRPPVPAPQDWGRSPEGQARTILRGHHQTTKPNRFKQKEAENRGFVVLLAELVKKQSTIATASFSFLF